MPSPAGLPHSVHPEAYVRLHYLDWLRVLAIVGVFLFHAVHPFDFFGWHIKNAEKSMAVTVFIAFFAPWGMPFFFMMAWAGSWLALQAVHGPPLPARTVHPPAHPLHRRIDPAHAGHAGFRVAPRGLGRIAAGSLLAVHPEPRGRLRAGVLCLGRLPSVVSGLPVLLLPDHPASLPLAQGRDGPRHDRRVRQVVRTPRRNPDRDCPAALGATGVASLLSRRAQHGRLRLSDVLLRPGVRALCRRAIHPRAWLPGWRRQACPGSIFSGA